MTDAFAPSPILGPIGVIAASGSLGMASSPVNVATPPAPLAGTPPVMVPVNPVTVPPLWSEIAQALAQKGLTILATVLTGYGVIGNSQQAQFVSLGLAVVAWGVSFAWTYISQHFAHGRLVAALYTPPPAT